MAINYFEGNIDNRYEPLLPSPVLIGDMPVLSEIYAGDGAAWFDERLLPTINRADLGYHAEQISPHSDPYEWIRIIRLPHKFLVDGSHRDDLFDDEGKLVLPIERRKETPDIMISPLVAKGGYVRNAMQLEAVEHIIKEQFGFELSRNLLHDMVTQQLEDTSISGEE